VCVCVCKYVTRAGNYVCMYARAYACLRPHRKGTTGKTLIHRSPYSPLFERKGEKGRKEGREEGRTEGRGKGNQ
jgi:hypothetical protein